MHRRDTATDDGYFPAPDSLDPMSPEMRRSLIAPGVMGLLSATSTLALILFILYRIMSWQKHYRVRPANDYVVLVLCLLIGDLQQAGAFVISWFWIAKNEIVAPSRACFAQGWLLHSGDVSSGLFILAIAVHTFLAAVLGIRIGTPIFYSAILGLWVFAYLLTGIGVGLHPNDYFVRAGAWCWVNAKYQTERLFLHYLWIFIIEFATIVVYAATFIMLRRKTKLLGEKWRQNAAAPNPKTIAAVNRITRLMTLYPCVYVLLTLPLSSGRMWSMAHNGAQTSNAFSVTAGALLASCGWVDALLYTLTRKKLLDATMPSKGLQGQGTIHTSEQVAIVSHGQPPEEDPMKAFEEAHRRHAQFDMDMPEDKRHNGCLIETPSSVEDNDPMQQRDWGPAKWTPQEPRRAQIVGGDNVVKQLKTTRSKW